VMSCPSNFCSRVKSRIAQTVKKETRKLCGVLYFIRSEAGFCPY
jgi:hypothetical protein